MKNTTTVSVTLKVNTVARQILYSLLAVVLFGTFIIINSGLIANTSFAHETSVNISQSVQPKLYDLPDVDNYVNIPYFTNSNEMTSTLVLNNDLPVVAKVEVTLFNHQGEALKLPTFTLRPLNAQRFDLALLTADAPSDFSSGNIQIFYHAPMMSITSQVTIASVSKRISFDSSASSTMDAN